MVDKMIHNFCALDYPADLQGQQKFFSRVLPAAERELIEALYWEFSREELRKLKNILERLELEDWD